MGELEIALSSPLSIPELRASKIIVHNGYATSNTKTDDSPPCIALPANILKTEGVVDEGAQLL